jgi:DDE family transposase
VMVGDRENDIYQAFTRKPDRVDLITRARGDRKLADGGLLFETAACFPSAIEIDVPVAPSQPRAQGERGRVARVAVSFGRATIVKPKTGRACADRKSCEINVVVAREIGAPAGAKPLLWRLLTTLPVETAEDALEIIRLYRLRWRVEEVFRVLKRDGLALEETQIETAPRLFNLAALAIVAAARIIQLTDARDASPRPATDVIAKSLIEATAAVGATLQGKTAKQKNPHPRGSLSWLAWITARLGGWHCYYKPPGPKTMADGCRRLTAMLDGYVIAHGKSLV